jgi:hypothetical protein
LENQKRVKGFISQKSLVGSNGEDIFLERNEILEMVVVFVNDEQANPFNSQHAVVFVILFLHQIKEFFWEIILF